MSSNIESLDSLISRASKVFKETFSEDPSVVVCAPGRVNLIGEHTDYNDGFVFPMALPLVTVIVGMKSEKTPHTCIIKSLDVQDETTVEFPVPSTSISLEPSTPLWANYIKGIIANFHCPIVGFNAICVSSVPMGGGLSSSAALEVATYTFLETLMGSKAESLKKKALICQKAEHDFAKVPCGIMDQFISTMGVAGNALLIDCRSLDSFLVPLSDPTVTFVVINSNVKHILSGSEYSTRRDDCYAAAKIMNKKSLRDATMTDFEKFKKNLSDVQVKRVRHVIGEIQRTTRGKEALAANDYLSFGRLMNESHASLRDDYEVSCEELNQLADIAVSVEGVFGSRMTGGGFGGCTVTLVRENCVDDLLKRVKAKYSGSATSYVCSPSDGAKVIRSETL